MEVSNENKNQLIGLICAICFIVLTLVIPFTGVLGGFFQQKISMNYLGTTIDQNNEYLWDGIEESALFLTLKVGYDSLEAGSQAGALWGFCQIWGMVYLLLTALGGGIVAFYAFSRMSGSELSSSLGVLGVLSGLIGTMGEWVILFITIGSEDWAAMEDAFGLIGFEATVTIPNMNLLLFSLFIVGWILLIFGYIAASKPVINQSKPETQSYEI